MAFSLSQTDVAARRYFRIVAFRDAVERWLEQERERIGLWAPVALGAGIAAWFALLDARMWAGWIALCCGMALAGARIGGGGRLSMVITGGAMFAAFGSALMWSKALLVGEPPLNRAAFAEVKGEVMAVERQPAKHRFRLLIAAEDETGAIPSRIRVNLEEKDMPASAGPGSVITFRSRLMPPMPPAVPGAYDFAQRAYFAGIGATGRALPPIRVIRPASLGGDGLRQSIGDHVRARLPGPEGAIALTLATGDRGAISESDEEAMRRSGLAHLLSISGLHVSALIGAVILITYRLLALWPRLALSLPLMPLAAGAGALAGIGYTILTGAEVPTVRSCIAALLVLGGLVLGREAISLRLVAFGALVVLLIWPEALNGPSFQMSFAAVTVIIALAETQWFRALTHRRDEALPFRLGRGLVALFLTGLAVEIALMPIAMFHFHQAGILGALANLIAIPLTTFVVMPAEALALALDAVGLGAPFWWIAGHALRWLLALAHVVAGHSLAVWALPIFPPYAFALVVAGGLWLLLWRTRWRIAGLVPLVVGGFVMATAPAPDLLVTGDGMHMAVRQDDGRLALLRGRAGDYVREVFADSVGGGAFPDTADAMSALDDAANASNARCSRDMCTVLMRRPERDWLLLATRSNVVVPWRALADACARADIVVSDRRLPTGCAPRWLKLDRAHLRATGGVAVYLDAHMWRGVHEPEDRHPWIPRATPHSVPR